MPGVLRQVRQWLFKTSERALNQAYEAATRIEAIELQYFDGKRVSPANADYGRSAMAYFEAEVKKNLSQIKRHLGEFRASNAMLPSATAGAIEVQPADAVVNGTPVNRLNQPAIWLKKMHCIDGVVARYEQPELTTAAEIRLGIDTSSPEEFDPEPRISRPLAYLIPTVSIQERWSWFINIEICSMDHEHRHLGPIC